VKLKKAFAAGINLFFGAMEAKTTNDDGTLIQELTSVIASTACN
jgi:hypothetical protein